MKKILSTFILLLSFFAIKMVVRADTFVTGDYIDGVFMTRSNGTITYHNNIRFILDTDGNTAYCIEPYILFKNNQAYVEYQEDFKDYKELTDTQKRRISLLAYFGYGYSNRKEPKWYAITQYLIWKEVNPTGSIYFTDTLQGNKIVRFESEIEALLKDVNDYDVKPSFVKDYTLNLNDTLTIKELTNDYEIVSSDFEYTMNNGYVVNKVNKSGKITIRKKNNFYDRNVTIFATSNSQDLIRTGNIINNNLYTINVNVTKGDITLDITKDDSVYTVESDLSNTCYEVSNTEGELVDKVCTGKDELIYKTLELPYGDYIIKQVSFGIGFKKDSKIYRVSIDKENEHPKVDLENLLIKNTIEIVKYACKDDVCGYEANALFQIYDILDNLVDTIRTNELGYASIVLGYGSYQVVQSSGIDNYTLVDSYQEKIVDETTEHKRTLFNYSKEVHGSVTKPEPDIEKEPEIEEDSDIEEEPDIEVEPEPDIPIEEDVILPPNTGINGFNCEYALLSIFFIVKKIFR